MSRNMTNKGKVKRSIPSKRFSIMSLSILIITALLLAVPTSADDPVVKTPLGVVRGRKQIDKPTGETIYEFRGVRYAKAPTGQRRFRKTDLVDAWEGEYDATQYGPTCPQILMELGAKNQSEDCLHMNIIVPRSLTSPEKLSVMFFIHGGGFTIGYGHFYDGTRLAVNGNVIVVTFNYRLGLLGFLELFHPASRGNYGLWDQKLALQWVQDNIGSFRGDPGSVTIFGESAGGISVSYQSLIPSNRGLFQRVIAQSGVAANTLRLHRNTVDNVLLKILPENTNCSADNLYNFVECLRGVDANALVKASDPWMIMPPEKASLEPLYTPSIDGDLFKTNPVHALKDRNSPVSNFFHSLDFMAGVMSQEGSLVYMTIPPHFQEAYNFNVSISIPIDFACEALAKPFLDFHYGSCPELLNNVCKFYTSEGSVDDQSNRVADMYGDFFSVPYIAQMLQFHDSESGGRTFQYQVSKTSPRPFAGPPPIWFRGSGHADDLINLFYFDGSGRELLQSELNDNDRLVSKVMIALWTSFAKTGVPNAGEGYLPWIEYDNKRKIYIDIDVELSLRQNLKADSVRFWSEKVPSPKIDEFQESNHDEL